MEHEELKTYVGKKVKVIWDAYQEALAELKTKDDPIQTTTQVAKDKKTKQAIGTANTVNVGSVADTVNNLVANMQAAKAEFDDLQLAIEAKAQELAKVHQLEVEANSLVALIAAKDKLVEEREERAETILAKSKEEAESIIGEANASAAAIGEASEVEDLKAEQERIRKQAEWDYNFARSARQATDELQDNLNLKVKVIKEREEAVTEREVAAEKLNKKIVELEYDLKNLEESTEIKIAEAVEKAKKSAASSAAIAKAMDEKTHQAAQSISAARIATLEEQMADLRSRLDVANQSVLNANAKVAEMAQSALKAGADAATVAKVSEIAAGSGKK